MKSAQIALAILLASTSATFAQGALDADGDGMVTLTELQAMYPDFTQDAFTAADTDASGALDEAEFAAAVEAEIVPAQE
jgi:EF hand domain-containing protein